jgi:hypothetical protein
MRVDSAILAHIANYQPSGATVPELALALGFERKAIQTAVETLTRLEIVSVTTTGKVVLGPFPQTGEHWAVVPSARSRPSRAASSTKRYRATSVASHKRKEAR